MNDKCLNVKTCFWNLEFENSFELCALTFDIVGIGSFDPIPIFQSHIAA